MDDFFPQCVLGLPGASDGRSPLDLLKLVSKKALKVSDSRNEAKEGALHPRAKHFQSL